MLTNEQLSLNQKFIDLSFEWLDSCEDEGNPHDYSFDPKLLMKYMYNRGYVLKPL